MTTIGDDMSTDGIVQLISAYEWRCPGCGATNFVSATRVVMSAEELIKMKKEMGIPTGEHGVPMAIPAEVSCERCRKTYETENCNEECDIFVTSLWKLHLREAGKTLLLAAACAGAVWLLGRFLGSW